MDWSFWADVAGVSAFFIAGGHLVIELFRWRRESAAVWLTVSPNLDPNNPNRKDCIGLLFDVQANDSPVRINAVYLAAFPSWLHWIIGRDPREVIGSRLMLGEITPGDGFEAIFPINHREQALLAHHKHVRLMVRHTGHGRLVSKPVHALMKKRL